MARIRIFLFVATLFGCFTLPREAYCQPSPGDSEASGLMPLNSMQNLDLPSAPFTETARNQQIQSILRQRENL
jgi:hypothetical protein